MRDNKVLTTSEMRKLDSYTCQKVSLSTLDLIEIVGKKIYEFIDQNFNINYTDKITVVSGLGNNGCDSLVVTYHLLLKKYNVNVCIVGKVENLPSETKILLDRISTLNKEVFYFNDDSSRNSFEKLIHESTYLIDGIFGTGLNRDVEGLFYQAIEIMNNSKKTVISIDIPSGIKGDNGNLAKIAVKADYSIIVQNYKIGNLLNDAKDFHGTSNVIDVGILQDEIESNRYLLIKEHVINRWKKRKHNTHKYNYGSVLTIGGSKGMTGAPLMSSYAELRSGAGLSSIAIRDIYLNQLNNIYPEIMVKSYTNKNELVDLCKKINAVAFGPGIGRMDDENYTILQELLELNLPIVVDADGLFYLKPLLSKINNGSNIIITPHYGEMANLFDVSTCDIIKDPLKYINMVTDLGITVVLKGPCSIIADKECMYFSNIGNPGMATAGSGDVLTGIIAGLLGQGYNRLDASKLGVYLHSLAGNYAKDKFTEYSLIATDIIDFIPHAIKKIIL